MSAPIEPNKNHTNNKFVTSIFVLAALFTIAGTGLTLYKEIKSSSESVQK